MQFLLSKKLMSANFLGLVIVKFALAYPLLGLIALISGSLLFSGNEIVDATNRFRQEFGISALTPDPELTLAAEAKLSDMLNNQYFAHVSPAGIDPWYWMKQKGYTYSYAGENLAIGFFDAAGTIQAWENSPSHRKNMADSRFTEIGVAVANSNINGFGGMVVVQMFGTPPQPTKSQLIARASPARLPTAAPSPSIAATPKVTQKTSPAVTVTPLKPAVTPVVTPKKSDSITLTYVKSETLPDDKVSPGTVMTGPQIAKSADILNRLLIIYAGLIAAASIYLLLTSPFANRSLFMTLIHLAILAAAIFYSPSVITSKALIF